MCVDRYPADHADVLHSAAVAVDENPVNAPLIVPGVDPTPLEMALLTGVKWSPGRVLRIAFMDGTAVQHSEVVAQAEVWLPLISIKFDWTSSVAQADIRISFKQSGAWSYLGTDALTIPVSEPTMNFGFLQPGTATHEFGHALGCIHEHQSPGAGVIPWIAERVYAYYGAPPNSWSKAQVDQNILAHYSKTLTQYTEWDRGSIMEYPIDAQLVADPSYAVGWNTQLSKTDKDYISAVYPKPVAPPPPPPPGTLRRTVVISCPATGSTVTVDGKAV